MPRDPMPWQLRAWRAVIKWLFAWQPHEQQALVAELRRQVSAIEARALKQR